MDRLIVAYDNLFQERNVCLKYSSAVSGLAIGHFGVARADKLSHAQAGITRVLRKPAYNKHE